MRVELEFMQLHEPLFLAGVNLGLKLYPNGGGKGSMHLLYDTDLRLGIVTYKGKTAIIQNIASATITRPEELGLPPNTSLKVIPSQTVTATHPNPHVKAQVSGPEKPVQVFTAQVSNPTQEVRRRPGRPPKFQGEESQGE